MGFGAPAREGKPAGARRRGTGGLLILLAAAAAHCAEPPDEQTAPSDTSSGGFWQRFKDPADGKFDLTAHSEAGSGFVPLVIPFNEPALGAGIVGAVMFFHPTSEPPVEPSGEQRNAPPTTSFGAAGVSDNDSWMALGGHAATLRDGRIRYLGLVGTASLNLDFYGIGGRLELDEPRSFNFAGDLLVQQAQFRIRKSPFAAGLRYVLLKSDVDFDVLTGFDLPLGETQDANLAAFVNYDTRDNLFTPNAGAYAQLAVSRSAEALGGDFDYWRVDLETHHYWHKPGSRLILGLRAELRHASEGAPFYSLPWIVLRGVPVMRYLGNYAATLELEPRWTIDGRWSVLAFSGIGRASDHLSSLGAAEAAYNYGFGFRYLLARQHGLAAGIDLAYGPEQSVIAFTFGNAWAL
ncbi:MAG TPA: BamA/TamA family outer membrane protein [Gammaproteobacteria bacterium]|nr:BamA/TamA family outer membrane protein [Gammaproteobacteria bacterium]